MKIEAVLKSIHAALKCVEAARDFSYHDMPDSVREQCGRAIGHLEATKLYLELENGTFGKEDKVPVQ